MRYLLSLLFIFQSVTAIATVPKAIYGEDNRADYERFSQRAKNQSRSVAMMVSSYHLLSNGDAGDYELFSVPTLKQREYVCPEVTFSDDLSMGECSGFLITDKLLATARHCLPQADMCDSFHWVFGRTDDTSILSHDQVYKCDHIDYPDNSWIYDGPDMVLVHLDRPVKHYYPLQMADSSTVDEGDKVYALGYPSGLNLKVAYYGSIRNTQRTSFESSLDLFQGNSGSPIFSSKSGKVIGMVISGNNDFSYDEQRGCFKLSKHKKAQERGIWILRSIIKFFSI